VGARVPAAQTTGTIDIAVSSVRYDGFLPSGAATFTPAVRWDRAAGTLTARGTYLRFQSGRRSLQGLVAASLFTPPGLFPRLWRGEISLSTGGSSYAAFASFWHATAEARLHFVVGGRGAWIGGTGGRTSYGSASRPVAVAGVGVWARRAGVTVTASANRSIVGDTAYSDLASTLHTSLDRVAVDGSIGARLSSRGAGRGVFGEASTTLTLGERTALFVSAGRYPTDPVRGSVAGRYASVGVRLRTALPRPPAVRDPQRLRRSPANGDGGASVTARLDVQPASDGMVRLVVSVSAAATVELAGDFTDWQPVALRRTVEGAWEGVLRIPSGAHRINVRVDGGEWTAPAGTTRVADEFGGEVGIVAVP
jgi:hypothetical protein